MVYIKLCKIGTKFDPIAANQMLLYNDDHVAIWGAGLASDDNATFAGVYNKWATQGGTNVGRSGGFIRWWNNALIIGK